MPVTLRLRSIDAHTGSYLYSSDPSEQKLLTLILAGHSQKTFISSTSSAAYKIRARAPDRSENHRHQFPSQSPLIQFRPRAQRNRRPSRRPSRSHATQTRAWLERSHYLDTLGRYEARLSRQLLKYQEEFERLQTVRKERERIDSHRSRNEIKRDQFDPASFVLPANSYRILSHLPPPKDPQTPPSCTAGDLVAGSLPQNSENMAA